MYMFLIVIAILIFQWEYTDGTIWDLYTLVVEEIKISYEFDVINSTIRLYGPSGKKHVDTHSLYLIKLNKNALVSTSNS